MIDGRILVAAAFTYVLGLFAIAYYGDSRSAHPAKASASERRPLIYSLSLAVYCTTWTYFGSVGVAASTGLDFLPVYFGPVLMFAVGYPLIERIARLAKSQNISSIADFIAARYGKNQHLALVVTLIAVAGSIPYIALQLKAVSESMTTVLGLYEADATSWLALPVNIALLVAACMAGFAILFGTRHASATEHQDGLMLAIAFESGVKLAAFLTAGLFVVYGMQGGFHNVFAAIQDAGRLHEIFSRPHDGSYWLTVTFLSFVCILLLPRQFHVAIVENRSPIEIRRAAWMFPVYLLLINLFVVPIAVSGLTLLRPGAYAGDMYVLALPRTSGNPWVTLFTFIGGLSAAAAMVIVESVALSIMVSNTVVLPLLLRSLPHRSDAGQVEDESWKLLLARRCAIVVILTLACLFYRTLAQSTALAQIGLLSFAAIAQFAPAFFGGLIWRRGTAGGAMAGIILGFAVWIYTLFVPWMVNAGHLHSDLLEHGPFGIALLKPELLFGLQFGLGANPSPIAHGVFWSLAANVVAFVLVSLRRPLKPAEYVQSEIFLSGSAPMVSSRAYRGWRSALQIGELKQTVARFVGADRAERTFAEFGRRHRLALDPAAPADPLLIEFAGRQLASAVGAASSRLVLEWLMSGKGDGRRSAAELLDDAAKAVHYNSDVLQLAMDQVDHGYAVFDAGHALVLWNGPFRTLLDLPDELCQAGMPARDIVKFLTERDFGAEPPEAVLYECLAKLTSTHEPYQETLEGGRVIEVRSSTMPQGGFVATFSDVTERVRRAEMLEVRVSERTAELTEAKAAADAANLSKTRFLTAASHDLAQPLNAARLYAGSLAEQSGSGTIADTARKIDASLDALQDILDALTEISKLDAGAMRPDIRPFRLSEIMERLKVELEPVAQRQGLQLTMMPTSLWVRTDRNLLHRMLRNLLTNAIKYTKTGRILAGARRKGDRVTVLVADTGTGVPADKQRLIFREYERLKENTAGVAGLGLGLPIVERMARILDIPIRLKSEVGRGTTFTLELERAEPQSVATPRAARRTGTGQLEGCRILCVDNDSGTLEGLQVLLGGWGCDVRTAHDDAEAATAMAGTLWRPDVLLVDYQLQQGTGLETVASLSALIGLMPTVAVITANRSPEVGKAVRDRGFALLYKPVNPAALRAFVARTHAARAEAG